MPWGEFYTWSNDTYDRLAQRGLDWRLVLGVLLQAWPVYRRDLANGWTAWTGQATDGRWLTVLVGVEDSDGARPVLDARELTEAETAEARRLMGGSDE